MSASLVGSEMCIRDSLSGAFQAVGQHTPAAHESPSGAYPPEGSVPMAEAVDLSSQAGYAVAPLCHYSSGQ
eukprot:1206450-Alexandrium_andersonii.AAC.1